MQMTDNQKATNVKNSSDQSLEPQWQAMKQDWQQQSYKKTDIKALTQQTARRILKAKLLFAIDLIATLLIVLYFILYFNDFENRATFYYMAFASITAPIYMYYSIKIRLVSWRLGQGTPALALKAAITACHSSIHYLQLLKLSSYILFIPINWYIIELKTSTEKSVLLALVITNLILIAMYLVSHYMQKKRLTELNKLQQLVDKKQHDS